MVAMVVRKDVREGLGNTRLELFGAPFKEIESLSGFLGGRLGGFFKVVGDFEHTRGVGRESGDLFRYVSPVDRGQAWPKVVVFGAVVVVKVELGDAGLEKLEGFVDARVFFGVSQVRVA